MTDERENREFDHDYLCELLENQNELLSALNLLLTSPIHVNVSTNGGTAVATTITLTNPIIQNNQ